MIAFYIIICTYADYCWKISIAYTHNNENVLGNGMNERRPHIVRRKNESEYFFHATSAPSTHLSVYTPIVANRQQIGIEKFVRYHFPCI